MKFSDPLRCSLSAESVISEQVSCLTLEMIEIRICWEAFYWHDELPFVCPRSALRGESKFGKSELFRSGGLLSFPRTGCALLRYGDLTTSTSTGLGYTEVVVHLTGKASSVHRILAEPRYVPFMESHVSIVFRKIKNLVCSCDCRIRSFLFLSPANAGEYPKRVV